MTKIVNIFSGPGSGKSTLAAGIFSHLKRAGLNVELAHEAAKTMAWENRSKAIKCQPYVFGKQLFKIERLIGEVDLIISDSPLILSAIYANKYGGDKYPLWSFVETVVDIFSSFDNFNIFLQRDSRPYNPKGRFQNEEEAKKIDNEILQFLVSREIPFSNFQMNDPQLDQKLAIVLEKMIKNESSNSR